MAAKQAKLLCPSQVQEHQQAAQRAAHSTDALSKAQSELARCQRRLNRAEKALLENRRSSVQTEV